MKETITYAELLLPESEWREFINNASFDRVLRNWIVAWELHELVLPPDNDEQRKQRRFGHYAGWVSNWEAEN